MSCVNFYSTRVWHGWSVVNSKAKVACRGTESALQYRTLPCHAWTQGPRMPRRLWYWAWAQPIGEGLEDSMKIRLDTIASPIDRMVDPKKPPRGGSARWGCPGSDLTSTRSPAEAEMPFHAEALQGTLQGAADNNRTAERCAVRPVPPRGVEACSARRRSATTFAPNGAPGEDGVKDAMARARRSSWRQEMPAGYAPLFSVDKALRRPAGVPSQPVAAILAWGHKSSPGRMNELRGCTRSALCGRNARVGS
eukprot:scaffold653_cov379-Prasinococcus_capsulatus_cf.AAC.12